MSVSEGIFAIFNHYGTPYKLSETAPDDDSTANSMDNKSFSKMCREAPELAKSIGRADVDLIFSKCKQVRYRRLNYENFLDSLLELSVKLFPDEEPTKAVALLLSRYIFGLFDQPPCAATMNVVDMIYHELSTLNIPQNMGQ